MTPPPPGLTSDEPTPAIIFGHSMGSLGVMRALGRKGIPAFMASPGTGFVSRSRWYRPCPNATETYPSPDVLADFLEGLPFERAVLIPCSDDWVPPVASLRPTLRDRFPASVADPEVVTTLLDKGRFAGKLARLGLPHPHTVLVNEPRDLEALPDRWFRNTFLKPRNSLAHRRRYGTKGLHVRSRDEARRLLARYGTEGQTFVLQEFIQGPPSKYYIVSGFVDRDGRVRAIFARQRLRLWPPDFGNGSCEVSVPLEVTGDATETLDRLLSDVRYRGIFSALFVRDPDDGGFRLLEVNVRAFEHIEFVVGCGVDLPSMAYRDALGLPVESVVNYRVGRRCVDLYNDLIVIPTLLRSGQITGFGWALSYLRMDELAFAWDDPGPGLTRLVELARREVQNVRQRPRSVQKS